jgi:purine-cytosine permease-like protein
MAAYNVNAYPPVYLPPDYQFNPVSEVNRIRDWLPWSIISIFIGGGLGGILPLIFSLICRSNKRSNDVQGARLMSTLALVFNIIITLTGIIGWIGLIVWIVLFSQAVKVYQNPNISL